MSDLSNVIAWLVPTARGSLADKATTMPENAAHTISISSCPALAARLPDILLSRPDRAIQLSFDNRAAPPKRPGRFTLGTNARCCDIVLPSAPPSFTTSPSPPSSFDNIFSSFSSSPSSPSFYLKDVLFDYDTAPVNSKGSYGGSFTTSHHHNNNTGGTGSISPQHCALRFDDHARLVLDDFSRCGTQVWYDWESCGDRTDYTWLLGCGTAATGFPSQAQRVTVDIQGARFQVVVNDAKLAAAAVAPTATTTPMASIPEDGAVKAPATETASFAVKTTTMVTATAAPAETWEDAYRRRVDAFCARPLWAEGLPAGWDRASVPPVAPLFAAAPLFRHIFVKSLGERPVGEVYLWNTSRPWEPMVKAVA